jgi:adenosylcobyric acid synthase
VVATTLRLDAETGPFAGVHDLVSGYEIHQGQTRSTDAVETPFAPASGGEPTAALGAARGRVVGTYLHGLFENRVVRESLVSSLFEVKGITPPSAEQSTVTPSNRAASLVARMDVETLLDAVGFGD